MEEKKPPEGELDELREREKELNCLYRVDDILCNHQLNLSEIFEAIIQVLPSGWRYPELCRAKLIYLNRSYQTPGFIASPLCASCSIKADDKEVGKLEVVYISHVQESPEGYFLEKERMLIRALADRIGQTISLRQMKSVLSDWAESRHHSPEHPRQGELAIILDFFRQNDRNFLTHICRKMTNHLLLNGISEAAELQTSLGSQRNEDSLYVNAPQAKEPVNDILEYSKMVFDLGEKHLGEAAVSSLVKKWIKEEQAYALVKAIGSVAPFLRSIIEEIRRFQGLVTGDGLQYTPKDRWITVGLISQLLSDKPEFINMAKRYISFKDFFDIINRIIYPVDSQGRLGGKSTGLFLAQKILEAEARKAELPMELHFPKTWYLSTDTITAFLQYNNLEELNEQKYKDPLEIQLEYPNIIQLIKNSRLPPDIVRCLSVALDDLGDQPLIVRSSSKLEDQTGAAFSGKYKSLFLANQGTKQQRLEALMDAILEVYASIFGPDPIQYRSERGLLDFHEEMGILIQEVVGRRVGHYFFPLFSGVAFSHNEYRWSPRLKREDGLLRMVPGLGTRAVDRLSDDFPVLLSPGQPGIRVNIVPEEIKRYAPKKIDLIDLEQQTFKTIELTALLRDFGELIPQASKIFSVLKDDRIIELNKFEMDFKKDDLVATFDAMANNPQFVKTIQAVLGTLQEKLGSPVDIEFAYDGEKLYLLQCRPQSSLPDSTPASIPKDILDRDIIFNAKRFIPNGLIRNISHMVYIDPEAYSAIAGLEELKRVGRVVGKLNSILPKRQFVLIGPGRWGSRGDIKLGVSVTYSDICNTAALIEVAIRKTGSLPELSFGTHFFQDLVEADIRYLPLYPDDEGVVFNHPFLTRSTNRLTDFFPEERDLESVIRVIDVPSSSDGLLFNIAMNADLEEALGYLSTHVVVLPQERSQVHFDDYFSDSLSWRWRTHMAERLAAELDLDSYGVQALYLFGSSNNGTAGPGSDIDLIVHFRGNESQKKDLANWLDGWSRCLAEMNFLKTGYRTQKLLDIHYITDADIAAKTPFALKLSDPYEPVRRLRVSTTY